MLSSYKKTKAALVTKPTSKLISLKLIILIYLITLIIKACFSVLIGFLVPTLKSQGYRKRTTYNGTI